MLAIDYELIYKAVRVGNEERLHYNGSYEVPGYMDGDKVTVVGFTKKKVKVNNGRETFNIRYDQIRSVAQEIQKQQREFLNSI